MTWAHKQIRIVTQIHSPIKENISTTVTNNLHAATLPAESSFVLKENCVCAVGAYKKLLRVLNSGRELLFVCFMKLKHKIKSWIFIEVCNNELSLYKDIENFHLPTWPDGKDDVAFLCAPINKGHTGIFLPVTHSLFENGSLAAYRGLNQ